MSSKREAFEKAWRLEGGTSATQIAVMVTMILTLNAISWMNRLPIAPRLHHFLPPRHREVTQPQFRRT